jgi:threonine aldolase
MKHGVNFASDNNAGIHPDVLKAIAAANVGHVPGYGDDPYTEAAVAKFRKHFGDGVEVLFVNNGTGANVIGLYAAAKSFNSILCSDIAHIFTDECNAVEKAIGCKLVPLPAPDGKIKPEQLKPHLLHIGDVHRSQPKVVSITQPTELGTLYTPEEVSALAAFAHKNGMFLHMDGARLCNAAVSLNLGLRQITAGLEVDILSFGGTKNGLMIGDAVVFFDKKLARDTQFLRKQNLHLLSKMRFISAQFDALLSNNLWLKNARHANAMTALLYSEIKDIPEIKVTQKVETNAVFAEVPRGIIPSLRKQFFFYVWNEPASEVRWMTAFDTTEDDVRRFVKAIKKAVAE